MKSLYLFLCRAAVWLDSERLSVGISAFYGSFIWAFHSFAVSSAFSAFNHVSAGIPPETVFAVPLLAAATLQTWGLHRHSPLCLMLGALGGFFVFFSALVSCCIVAPFGTGVPAYLGLSAFYLVLALRRATGREYQFSP